ncbi:hypothetical protein [Polaribacter sp. KT 15]|uniref:hypothetical protein n=1 Tax=Polaribacter sp. KT 15 TaxID=1896175 RepID=UPI0009095CA0|nr:hypothetical protein [Polaribacter sp. KT 15]SHM80395.1 hypothetical protein SAMN05720268_0634 [Polaribacter sp. KT 15]
MKNLYYKFLDELEYLIDNAPFFLIILALFILRNLYNYIIKRYYRGENEELTTQNEQLLKEKSKNQQKLDNYIKLESENLKSNNVLLRLKQELAETKKIHFESLSKKEQEIAKHKETNKHQKRTYEQYVNFKNVEANNTRLGAHFIKNVISQIYDDMEQTERSYKSFLGISYSIKTNKNKIPPIKALKNIFKLLDYNVTALHKENTSLKEELEHIQMFLDLIKYLKPNTKIAFNNTLNREQKSTIKIKPTLFFPFVENALKHGSLNNNDSFISIILKENEQKQLSYCLVNSVEQGLNNDIKVATSSSFGLNALQQLLNAYYPKSKLEHKTLPNNQYLSELTLSLN